MSERRNLIQKKGGAQPARAARPAAPAVYRPQPTPRVLQAKAAPVQTPHAEQTPRRPVAPQAYRPQPTPRVLQKKSAAAEPPSTVRDRRAPESLPPARPRPANEVVRPSAGAVQPKPAGGLRPRANAAPSLQVVQPKSSRQSGASVVQAIKVYPNLHPGAVERIEPNSLFRLENFTDQYRLRKGDGHGVYVPNQQYNFVRTTEGQMLLHSRYRHPSIAEGRQVLYAGEAYFNNGKLEWWSNGSGHYQPDSEDAAQASLPMDQFYTYQQVIKGEHKRKGTR